MSFIRTQFRALREFYRRGLKWPLVAAAAAFVAAALISYFVFAANTGIAQQVIEFFTESVAGGVVSEDGSLSAPLLFLNNLRACLVSVLLGFIPFFFVSAFSAVVNAGLIGAMLSAYAANGYSVLQLVVFGLLPHGIFELPAIILSLAMGISLCLTMCRAVVRLDGSLIVPRLKELARVFIINIIPLLLLAAAAETWLTPALLRYGIM